MLYRDTSNLASMGLNNHTPVAWITNRELSTDYFSNKETVRLNHSSYPMRGTNMPVVVTSRNEAGTSIPPEGTIYIPIQVFANAPGSMRNYPINYANVVKRAERIDIVLDDDERICKNIGFVRSRFVARGHCLHSAIVWNIFIHRYFHSAGCQDCDDSVFRI